MKKEIKIRKIIREMVNSVFEVENFDGEMEDNIKFFDEYQKDQEDYLKSMTDKAKDELRTVSSKKIEGEKFKDLNSKNIAQKRAEQSAWEKTQRDFKKFSDNLSQSKEYIEKIQQTNTELQQSAQEKESAKIQPPETPSMPV